MSLRDGRIGQSPVVAKARARYRHYRDTHIDQPLRKLELARQALVKGECDILVVADSTCLFGSRHDSDSTRLPGLIARETGLRVVPIAVGGFGVRYHNELLRILDMLPQRPRAVVHSMAVRTMVTQIVAHPIYSYPASWPRLQAIQSPPGRIRSWYKQAGPTVEQYAAYEAIAVRSHWSGETTIGDYRRQLKGIGRTPWPIEKEKLAFDFFHGEIITPQHPGLDQWREFSRRIEAYGVPAVSYLAPPPIDRGELHYPGEFRDITLHNRKLVVDAIHDTAGRRYLLAAEDFPNEDFADFYDATEHFSYGGRAKLTANVVAGLQKLGVV